MLRLDLVVELLGDPFAHLGQDSTGIDAGRQALQDRADEAEIAQIGLDRLGHVGALDLDRDLRSVVRARAMDLPQGRDRERVLLEVAEQLADAARRARARDLADATEGDGPGPSRSVPSAPREGSRSSASIERNCAILAPPPFIRRSWAPSSSVSASACASPRVARSLPGGTTSSPRPCRGGLLSAATQHLPPPDRIDLRRLRRVDEVLQDAHEAKRVVEVREVARRPGRPLAGCPQRAGGPRARGRPG